MDSVLLAMAEQAVAAPEEPAVARFAATVVAGLTVGAECCVPAAAAAAAEPAPRRQK